MAMLSYRVTLDFCDVSDAKIAHPASEKAVKFW